MSSPSNVLGLLAFSTLVWAGHAQRSNTTEACTPSAIDRQPGVGCPDCNCCAAIQGLPLREWSHERSESTSFPLPWGQEYKFSPLDYGELATRICDCLEESDEELPPGVSPEDFVTRNGTKFMLHGRPFYFLGFNHPQLVRYASTNDTTQQDYFNRLLEAASAAGMTVGRAWASFEGYDLRAPDIGGDPFPWVSLQMEPGLYNEATFKTLDEVLVLSRKLGMRVILSLADYQGSLGAGQNGFEPYLMWVKGTVNITGMTIADFYFDERVKLLYKANLCAMANRVNHLTGIKYKHDPTIFSWELINEGTCLACPGPMLDEVPYRWLEEMSAFMKCVDPVHMVSAGMGGNYGRSTLWRLTDNPGPWALCFGEDFSRFFSLPTMDYSVAHMYDVNRGSWNDSGREPCGYEDCLVEWYYDWIRGHINESTCGLDKPFILEEFGLPYNETLRNQMFGIVREIFRESRRAMFWLPAVEGEPNTNGLNVYLDGSRAPYPPENQYGAKRLPATQKWYDAIRAMSDGLRRENLKDACMDQAKYDLYSTYNNQVLKMYSSNSTVALLSDIAADSAAHSASLAQTPTTALQATQDASKDELPSNSDSQPVCLTCASVRQLPLQQCADGQQQGPRNASTQLPWGQEVAFEPVDYADVAEVVCKCLAEASPAARNSSRQFVQQQGTQFLVDSKPFYFTGFNAWQLPWLVYTNRTAAAEQLLEKASELGFKVGRTLVPTSGPDTRMPSQREMLDPFGAVHLPLQPQANVYSEAAFEALDQVIALAEQAGIRLVLVLGSTGTNLGFTGPGLQLQFMQWVAGTDNVTGLASVQDFYTDERARLLFKAYLCTLANRVNSITGKRYKDDPTIFSWDIIQSPKCPGCEGNETADALVEWADEMTSLMKCVDPNHLVSLGQEGFYGPDPEERITTNPLITSDCLGADFLRLSSLPGVDYTTMQVFESLKEYNDITPNNSELVGKPIVVTDVAKAYHEDKRNQLFQLLAQLMDEDRAANPMSPAAGFIFNTANIGGQVDWNIPSVSRSTSGRSIYLDGSLPLPGPEQSQALPPMEQAWVQQINQIQNYFNRKTQKDNCVNAALTKLSSIYNTTEAKVYESASTVDIIEQMAREAERASS